MARVREVEDRDLEAVGAVARSIGWPPPIREGWRRLWEENPALDGAGPPLPRGWILEDGAKIGGFLCNLAQLYHFEGRTLRAVVASSLIVTPAFRGQSLQLVTAYARQPGVDLLLNTTASPESSKIFQFLKFDRIPQPAYNRNLYWVLGCAGFLRSALLKKGFPAALSRPAGWLLAPALGATLRVLRRGPRFRGGPLALRVVRPEEAGEEFDDLWQRKTAGGSQLLAHRDARTLRWHFAAAGRKDPPLLLAAYEGSRLKGYVALVRQDNASLHLRRARIADLFVEGDDPDTIRQLLQGAARTARDGGADMLEVVGFPESYQKICQEYRPFELWDEAWPFLYRARDPELHRALACSERWHACLYDGDGAI
jgi:hypothetical protein